MSKLMERKSVKILRSPEIHAWIQEFRQGTCRGRQLTKKALTMVLFYKEGPMAISKKTC